MEDHGDGCRRRTLLRGVLGIPAGLALGTTNSWTHAAAERAGYRLRKALLTARAGDTVLVPPGVYGGAEALEITVPNLTLKAAVALRSVLRVPLEVRGAGVVLDGLAFLGDGDDDLYLAAAQACRDSLTIASPGVEVRGCDFGFFPQRAILVRPTGLKPYIHDCSFHDNRDGGSDPNTHEAISLGYDNPSSHTSLRARIIKNRFWNLDVEGEAISVKTSDNLIQANNLSSSRAGFSNRYGERNCFSDNVLTNCRGFAIGGRGTRLLNNRLNGRGAIAIHGGDARPEVRRNGVHPAAVDTYLDGNSGPLAIGVRYRPLPAVNTRVLRHGGSIRLVNETGTVVSRKKA
jgi:hypothetical protein